MKQAAIPQKCCVRILSAVYLHFINIIKLLDYKKDLLKFDSWQGRYQEFLRVPWKFGSLSEFSEVFEATTAFLRPYQVSAMELFHKNS